MAEPSRAARIRAARAQVALDKKLGRASPTWVRELAEASLPSGTPDRPLSTPEPVRRDFRRADFLKGALAAGTVPAVRDVRREASQLRTELREATPVDAATAAALETFSELVRQLDERLADLESTGQPPGDEIEMAWSRLVTASTNPTLREGLREFGPTYARGLVPRFRIWSAYRLR